MSRVPAWAVSPELCAPLVLLRALGGWRYTDYSASEKVLELRLGLPKKRVLVVDQWVETGGTMHAAVQLLERNKLEAPPRPPGRIAPMNGEPRTPATLCI